MTRDPEQAIAGLKELLATLREDDEEKCAWVADALQGIEVLPSQCDELLVDACSDNCIAIAAWACKLLARVTPSKTEYQVAVARVLESHSNTSVRQEAAKSLGRMGPLTHEVKAKLEAVVAEAEDPRLQRLARSSLEKQAA